MTNSIGRVTSILSIPYGYTVSLWSAGALTVTRIGPPSALEWDLDHRGGRPGTEGGDSAPLG